MPVLMMLWQYRRIALYVVVAALVAYLGWRSWAYGAVKDELETVHATLAAELACEAGSECERRTIAAAREAEEKAAQAASDALAGAMAREEAAQREASEWRRKFRAAQQENPECADWSRQPVRCPL